MARAGRDDQLRKRLQEADRGARDSAAAPQESRALLGAATEDKERLRAERDAAHKEARQASGKLEGMEDASQAAAATGCRGAARMRRDAT